MVARGPFPERLMNVCAQNGISFWALEWRDGHTLSMTVRQEDRKQLWKLAERVGCTVETEGEPGPARLSGPLPHPVCLSGGARPVPGSGVHPVQLRAHHPGDRERDASPLG